jgi:glycosyltransferase involved in cell wall biosynthesis
VCVGKRDGVRLGTGAQVAALLADLRPDVLHTHQVGALFHAGRAARALGIPVVVHTEHGNHLGKPGVGRLRRWRTAWLWWWAARYARKFYCVSRDIMAEMSRRRIVPAHKLAVVLNGIDTDPFREAVDRAEVRAGLGIPADAPVVGTVGRLNEVKNQDLLIRAFARVRSDVPAARLLLVGDGPLRADLQGLAARLGVGDAVHFAGYQSRPERFLGAMDVFALTSRIEGMPLAVLEAFAAGVPVVASRVGGVPEVVDSGNNGFVFEYGDETALVGRLLELLNGPELARHVGEAGRDSARSRYSAAVMAAAYHRHYLELLGHVDLNPTSYRPVPTVSYVPTHA